MHYFFVNAKFAQRDNGGSLCSVAEMGAQHPSERNEAKAEYVRSEAALPTFRQTGR